MLIVGHSHVACVEAAATSDASEPAFVNFWNAPGAIVEEEGRRALAGHVKQRIRTHPGPLFMMMGGSAHTNLGLLAHARRWDVYMPDEGDAGDASAELIPYAAIKAHLTAAMAPYLDLMEQALACATGAVFDVQPPPPLADAESIARHVPWDMFPGLLREIAPAKLRHALWRIHSTIAVEWCARRGVDMITSPPGTSDPGGYLLPEFSLDGLHGNTAYGALVLERMHRAT